MKFRPLHDRVVVRRIAADERTAGGVIIPDTAKEKPQQGEVLATGPGKRDATGKLVALGVKEGDAILFGKRSGTEVKIDGEDLLIMKEDDILGVVEGAAKGKGPGRARLTYWLPFSHLRRWQRSLSQPSEHRRPSGRKIDDTTRSVSRARTAQAKEMRHDREVRSPCCQRRGPSRGASA
jgi:chaperonin GroES